MAKKTISFRVPDDTYNEFEQYRQADDPDADDVSKADAGRRLLETGLKYENGELAATDGGTPEKIEETKRESRLQNALIGAALLAWFTSQAFASPLVAIAAVALATIVIVVSAWPMLQALRDADADADREVSPDA